MPATNHLVPGPDGGVSLSELADITGAPLRKLSTLAIADCFPSVTVGTQRRAVHPAVAEALVVLVAARLDSRPILRAVFRDPSGVARATGRVAEILVPAEQAGS